VASNLARLYKALGGGWEYYGNLLGQTDVIASGDKERTEMGGLVKTIKEGPYSWE
jgi:hypothetical protein